MPSKGSSLLGEVAQHLARVDAYTPNLRQSPRMARAPCERGLAEAMLT
jgi:hypothetical protein